MSTTYSFVLRPKQGRLPGSTVSCECLSDAVLLTPQRQHGSLARIQCRELKLWPWRHVGGRSYVVSTFFSPSSSISSSSVSPYSCTSHTDLWPSSMRPPGGGGGGALPGGLHTGQGRQAQKQDGGGIGAKVLGVEGGGGEVSEPLIFCRLTDQRASRAAMLSARRRSGRLAVPSTGSGRQRGGKEQQRRQQQRAPVSHAPPCESEPSSNGSCFM